jgi:hypothetical protein
MFNIIKRRSTHASKLERWMGRDFTAELSKLNKGWYGPPIAVAGVPGCVYVGGDGDFVGNIDAGGFQNCVDYAREKTNRALNRMWQRHKTRMSAGFADLEDLIFEATKGGKGRVFSPQVANAGGVAGTWNDPWSNVKGYPPAGTNGAAAPGGTTYSSTSTGSIYFRNPESGDWQFFVQGEAQATGTNNTACTYLLTDRLFSVQKTMNSTASEAVTGVPPRYQSTTAGDWDYAGGNFVYPAIGNAGLSAGAHNWTVCQYTDQGGNTGQSIPSIAGRTGAAQYSLDLPAFNWFMPLAAGDTGIKELTQMQMSAAIATGDLYMTIAHPIAWFCCPVQYSVNVISGINSAWQMTRIFDDACLSVILTNSNNGPGNMAFTTVAG